MANSWIDPDEEERAIAAADNARAGRARIQPTESDVARARQIIRDNPNLTVGLLNGFIAAQVEPQQAKEIAQDDDGGFIGSLFSVAGDVIDHVTDGAAWALDKADENFFKPIIRGTISGLDAFAQEAVQRPLTAGLAAMQGEAPSFGAAYQQYGDSALVNVMQGQGTLGTGYLPGDTAQAQSDAERTLTIRGRRADVGQAIANGVVGSFSAPGETTYNTLAGLSGFAVEVFGDPGAWLTGGVSKVAKAAKIIDKAAAIKAVEGMGGIAGARRNTALVESAVSLFKNEDMLDRLAKADAYEIMQKWSGSPANRVDHKLINALGQATDKAEISELLLGAVAKGDVTQRGFYSGMGHAVKGSLVDSNAKLLGPFRYMTAEGKLSGLAPTGRVDANNIGEASQKVDSLLRQANVPKEMRSEVFNDLVGLEDGDFGGLFRVVRRAVDEVETAVAGKADSTLNDIVEEYRHELDNLRAYGVDSWGHDIDVPYAKKKIVQNYDGSMEEVVVPTPQALVELNSMGLHLPDVTDIRRAATQNRVMRAVYMNKGWDITADSTRFITKTLFKPLAILRPAYIVRIGAEEQARLTASHLDSVFSHPARFISANILNRKEVKTLIGKDSTEVAKSVGVITRDAQGIVADKVQSQGRIFTIVKHEQGTPPSPKFTAGWRSELGQIAADDGMRMMTFHRGDTAAFKVWAQSDEGMAYMREFATADRKGLLGFGDEFDDWAASLAKRTEGKTAGYNDELWDRIVNMDIPAKSIGKMPDKAKGEAKSFNDMLRRLADEGNAPAAVKAEHLGPNVGKHRDMFVNKLFDYITGKPTSYLARYPAFRQQMVVRTGDLFDSLASDSLRREAYDAAVKNLGMTKKETKALRDVMNSKMGVNGPIESLVDLDELVVGKSAQDVKDLLFDVTNRGAGQQAMEVVVPFLDAWKEVTRTWSRILKENPAFFVRAQAGYREMQDQGHFYANQHGDEVFNYPASGVMSAFVRRMNEAGGDVLSDTLPALGGAIVDNLTGNTPDYGVKMEGRVQGLNLVAQGVGPGFGPVIQWGAGIFDSPDLDNLRAFIAPFGTGISEADDLASPSVLENLMPAWMQKFYNAVSNGDIDERQWNSTIGDAMKALVASGDYKPEEPDKLAEDAERFGHWLLVARGFMQAVGPTGPSATVEVEANADPTLPDWNPEIDPDGKMFAVGVLAKDYYRLLQTYGPGTAEQKFFDLYGLEPFFIKQAKSRSLMALPTTKEGDRWMQSNREIVNDYEGVAAFFGPPEEGAELDFNVYGSQFLREERQSLTPKQQQEEATKVKARSIYAAFKDRAEEFPTQKREDALRMIKGRLESMYPGWESDTIGLGSKMKLKDQITQLKAAAQDPRLADNDVTGVLQTYLGMRDAVEQIAFGMGLSTLSSDKLAPQKAALAQAGQLLQQRYPEFRALWNEVLSREVAA